MSPDTNHVLEQVATTRWGTGATVTYRVTYQGGEHVTVSPELFSTDGYHETTFSHASTPPTSAP